MFKIKPLIFICSIFFATINYGQSNKQYHLGINYHYGFAIPEYNFVNYIVNDNVKGIQVSFSKKTNGKNYWETIYKYPEWGLSLFYSTLGNNDVFGKEIALNYFFKINIINQKNWNIYNHFGIGIGYVTKKFNADDNFYNVAVGSKFNIHFNYRLGSNIKISKAVNLNLGLSFDHLSNANTSDPNLGINSLTGFAGIQYSFGKQIETITKDLPPIVKVNSFEIYANIGGKQTRSISSDYFITSSFGTDFYRNINRALSWGIGADMFYDSSMETQFESLNNNKEFKAIYNFQTGLHASFSVIYNKFSFSIQQGIYIGLTRVTNDYILYNRGVIKYFVTDALAIKLAMKSHLHILDYPEIGISYKF